jgi:quinoprotein glucose dehydrogenase
LALLEIVWNVRLGTSDELEAKGMHNTGAFGQGGSIATAGGWSSSPAPKQANPMTYLAKNGKQYGVIVSSGVNAFTIE